MICGEISPESSYKLNATSLPYCIFRNKEKYCFNQQAHRFVNIGSKPDSHTYVAWKQSQYYHDYISDNEIPSALLRSTIKNDLDRKLTDMRKYQHSIRHVNQLLKIDNLKYIPQTKSTVANIYHENRSYIIHSTGKFLDELCIRDPRLCPPYNQSLHSYGFNMPLNVATPIEQIEQCGSIALNTSANILVRSKNELFHFKTASLTSEAYHPNSQYKLNYNYRWNHDHVILQPLQRYSLASNIIRLSCSSSSLSYSILLNEYGNIFKWNPNDGVISTTTKIDISHDHRDELSLECSLHPQLYYVGLMNKIHLYDQRSSCQSSVIKIFDDDSHIHSILQHPHLPNHIYVSVNNRIKLFDIKYMQRSLAERELPEYERNTLLKFVKMKYFNSNESSAGILLSTSPESRVIYTHSTEPTVTNSIDQHYCRMAKTLYGDDITTATMRKIVNGKAAYGLLACASSKGRKNTFNWSIKSLPVVDRSSADVELWGVDLIPIDTHYWKTVTPHQNKTHDKLSLRRKRKQEELDDDDYRYENVISNRYGDRHTDENELNEIDLSRTNAMLVQQSSMGDVFAQLICLEKNDSKALNSTSVSVRNNSSSINSTSLNRQTHLEKESSHASMVQEMLPSGIVCPAWKSKIRLNVSESIIPGISLGNPVTVYDRRYNIYPKPSNSFLPLLEDFYLKRFEIIQMDPKKLSRKIQTLSRKYNVGRSRALLDGKSVKKIKPPLKKSKFHWTKNIDELHELFENYELRKQICLKLIHDQFTTLWELWNIIYDLTLRVVDFKDLRRYLKREHYIQEIILETSLNLPLDNTAFEDKSWIEYSTFDGLRVRRTPLYCYKPTNNPTKKIKLSTKHSNQEFSNNSYDIRRTRCTCNLSALYSDDDCELPCGSYLCICTGLLLYYIKKEDIACFLQEVTPNMTKEEFYDDLSDITGSIYSNINDANSPLQDIDCEVDSTTRHDCIRKTPETIGLFNDSPLSKQSGGHSTTHSARPDDSILHKDNTMEVVESDTSEYETDEDEEEDLFDQKKFQDGANELNDNLIDDLRKLWDDMDQNKDRVDVNNIFITHHIPYW